MFNSKFKQSIIYNFQSINIDLRINRQNYKVIRINGSEKCLRIDSIVQIHADRVILFDLLIEKYLHHAVHSQRFLDTTLNYKISTLNPIFVLTSIGLKNLMSFGSKNMYLTVHRLLFIL